MESFQIDDDNPFVNAVLQDFNSPNKIIKLENSELQPNLPINDYQINNTKTEPDDLAQIDEFHPYNNGYENQNYPQQDQIQYHEQDYVHIKTKSIEPSPVKSEKSKKIKKEKIEKRGRPKGTKNTPKKVSKKTINAQDFGDKLPKMKPNIHCIQLSNENIEKYRKMESFIQPGVCFSIAPNLDHCKECASQRKRYARKEVDCRFYQFRKLRFNGDEIEVVGFLSSIDPIQVDRTVWLPIEKSKFKIPLQESRLMLQYCGDELCYIIEKDKSYLHKYKCENSELIWKRTIERVSEICDLCSTTLFNLHFICSICGISLCFDCIDESKDGSFDISCSIPDKEAHTHADLKLTQIIVEDSMDKLQKLLHETCLLWNIDHKCDLSHVKIENSKRNLAKNMLLEHQTGKNTLNREIPQKLVSIEKVRDFLQIPLEQNNLYVEEEFDIDTAMNEIMIQPNEKLYNVKTEKKIMKPLRHFTESEREVIISIPRFMNQESSNVIYPNVPHSWLCKGKLLRLHDPNNPKNTEVFEDQWKRGQPVIISNIGLDKNLWIPQSFAKEFGKDTSDFVNCLNGNLVKYREMSEFWDGFEYVSKRILDNSGKPILLKLKDWPPDSDFKNIMPSRFEDFMNNLPFSSYTHRNGDLNIIKYLPTCFLHPDLGPKGYFAYGDPFFKKEGTTNLHLDVSDACNVMCYVGFPRDKDMSTYLQEGYNAMIEADCDRANIMRVIEQGEIPGAIWHIYQAADADRIRDFILKISYEKGLKYAPGHDVIHDQNWYLNKEMRQRLLDEYSVEGYAIVQCIGDCVVLPAGTPHQVRNIYSCIKVAEDFVSPQQISHCLHLSQEFRKLTKTHTNNEEKVNVKNVIYHTCKEAIGALDVKLKRSMSIACNNFTNYSSMSQAGKKEYKRPKRTKKTSETLQTQSIVEATTSSC